MVAKTQENQKRDVQMTSARCTTQLAGVLKLSPKRPSLAVGFPIRRAYMFLFHNERSMIETQQTLHNENPAKDKKMYYQRSRLRKDLLQGTIESTIHHVHSDGYFLRPFFLPLFLYWITFIWL